MPYPAGRRPRRRPSAPQTTPSGNCAPAAPQAASPAMFPPPSPQTASRPADPSLSTEREAGRGAGGPLWGGPCAQQTPQQGLSARAWERRPDSPIIRPHRLACDARRSAAAERPAPPVPPARCHRLASRPIPRLGVLDQTRGHRRGAAHPPAALPEPSRPPTRAQEGRPQPRAP